MNEIEIASRELWAECLPEESDGFMNYYYSVKTRDNWIQRDEADGQLVSMIHWNPYQMHVRGRLWDTRYVIAVATKKEYRRQGRMARLLTEGMQKYAVEGVPFVWLMPIAEGIYEPFDFRYVYEKCEGEWPESVDAYAGIDSRDVEILDAEGLKSDSNYEARELQGGEILKIRILHRNEYEEAAAFMNHELAKRYEVFTERNAKWLEVVEAEVASEDGHIWGAFDENGLAGVFHEWRGDTIEIRELVCKEKYESGTGSQSLISAVRNTLCSEEDIKITAITTGWLGEPKPIIMARIINVKEFVKIIWAKIPQTLMIEIYDPLIWENNGIFRWNLNEWGSKIEKITPEGEAVYPDLKLSIAELTEWLFGRRNIPGYEDIFTLSNVFLNEIV